MTGRNLTKEKILQILSEYRKKHREEFGIVKIGIFGSFAKQTETEASDVDVFVELKKSNLFTLSRIRIDLEELLGKRVDLVQLRERMNQYLKRHIEEDAISA